MLMQSGTADDPARVVNVGSVMGEVPMGDGAYSYSASKAAVLHLTKNHGQGIVALPRDGQRAGSGAVRIADDGLCYGG